MPMSTLTSPVTAMVDWFVYASLMDIGLRVPECGCRTTREFARNSCWITIHDCVMHPNVIGG